MLSPDAACPAVQPTVDNWETPALLRWSFQHMADVFPAGEIARGTGPVAVLPPDPVEVDRLEVPLGDEATRTVADIIASTNTDAWMVLHRGRVAVERYANTMTPSTRHLLMSASKSLVATVAGALMDQQIIDAEGLVATYVPELTGSGYAEATIRHLLDMRSGISFDREVEVRLLGEACGWATRTSHDSPRTLKQFLCALKQDEPHGGSFLYRNSETDVLGWVCEAAAGQRFPQLASDVLWSRLGAQADAYICLDSEGTGWFDGGICATLSDLARFGAMILGEGVSLTGQRVLPAWWVQDVFTGGADSATAFAANPETNTMPGGMYRSKFWFPTASRDVALCRGKYGQMVYLNRATGTVGVKLSSWPTSPDDRKDFATLRMFDTISAHLAVPG